jgi:DNA-binding IclR family transcriptional regulator
MQLVGALDAAQLPTKIRQVREQLAEFTALGFVPDPNTRRRLEVFSIATPILDDRGLPRLSVSLHPFRHMTNGEVQKMGRRLVGAANAFHAQP